MQIRGPLLFLILFGMLFICMVLGYADEHTNDTPELMTMEELRHGSD